MTGQNRSTFWTLASGMLLLSLVMAVAGPSSAWGESRHPRSRVEMQRPRMQPEHFPRQPLQHRQGVPQRFQQQHDHHHHHSFGHLGFHFFGYPYFYGPYYPYYYSPYYYSPYYAYAPYAPGEYRIFPAFRLPGLFYYPGAIGKGEEGFQTVSPQERHESQDLVVPLDLQKKTAP
jgi:hypothetical protein